MLRDGLGCASDGKEGVLLSPTAALRYKPESMQLPLVLLNSRPLLPWAISRLKEALSASRKDVQLAVHVNASATQRESFQLIANVRAAGSPAAGLQRFIVGMAMQRHLKHELVLQSRPQLDIPLLDVTTAEGLAALGTYLGLPPNATLHSQAHQHPDLLGLKSGTAQVLAGVLPRRRAVVPASPPPPPPSASSPPPSARVVPSSPLPSEAGTHLAPAEVHRGKSSEASPSIARFDLASSGTSPPPAAAQQPHPKRSMITTKASEAAATVSAADVAEAVTAALLNWQPLHPESKASLRELLEAHNWTLPAGLCACPRGMVAV